MLNQTNPDDLFDIQPEELGTGYFLIPDVESDEYGAATKVPKTDITYSDCIRRGEFTMGYRWVPNRKAQDLEAANATNCKGPCNGECWRRGHDCVCNDAQGRCCK
ncbi:hypothetical protein SAMN05445850_0405 [Paraburkholderia tuberum]|uniref:Uncharacterized protein n=1 Tax=Paraburkholderia tuberum TaxID=157910 RepID=A0A1H1A9R0_9BURK|nr:hypothetical protein SAMN05445850_0405 [Paraburkholderia tuberum]